MDHLSVKFDPIGFVRTGHRNKFSAPSQPEAGGKETNYIELVAGNRFELALQDLDSFDRIWIVSWFHQNTRWRPRVMPPRGPAKRRGVFSTRSPHRPNSIGLTSVPLLSIKGLILEVGPLDLVDGTPILDIKPYLRTVDSYPDSSLGWLEEIRRAEEIPPEFQIEIAPQAERELDWLRQNWGIDFTERAFDILRRDPRPHRTRRILHMGENSHRIACGAWRMFFELRGTLVRIESVGKGYSDEALAGPDAAKIIDREAQVSFAAWKGSNFAG